MALLGPFVSTFRLRHLNADPLPSPAALPAGETPVYGTVVGGDTALDEKDEGASYVSLSIDRDALTRGVITFRPLFDPPIPPDAIAYLNYPEEAQADYAQLKFQFRFQDAPYMPPAPSSLGPSALTSVVRSDYENLNPITFIGRFADSERDDSEDAWGTSWWDETNSSNHSEPQPWNGFSLFQVPILLFDPTQYFFMFWEQIFFSDPLRANAIFLSQLVGQITWYRNSTDIELSALRLGQRNDGLGISGHPRLRAGKGSTSRQTAHAPRIGGSNLYE